MTFSAEERRVLRGLLRREAVRLEHEYGPILERPGEIQGPRPSELIALADRLEDPQSNLDLLGE